MVTDASPGPTDGSPPHWTIVSLMRSLEWKIVIPWILTAIGFCLSLYQYVDKADFEARKPFVERQTVTMASAIDTVATLATATDDSDWDAAEVKFRQLYWGGLSMVEDPLVERWMVAVRKRLDAALASGEARPLTTLQGPSYCLAHAGRDLVLRSWRVNPESVTNRLDGSETCAALLVEIEKELPSEPAHPVKPPTCAESKAAC